MKMEFTPHGVCSRKILLDVENGIVQEVRFIGGCDGNAKGISALVKGMPAEEVIRRLDGITCENKKTSCPAQLAESLKQLREKNT